MIALIGSLAGSDDSGDDAEAVKTTVAASATLGEAVTIAQQALTTRVPDDTLGSVVRGICGHDVDSAAAAAASLALTVDVDELVNAARSGADAYCPSSKELNGSSARDVNLAASSLAGIPTGPGSETTTTAAAPSGAVVSPTNPPATNPPTTTKAPVTTRAPATTRPPVVTSPPATDPPVQACDPSYAGACLDPNASDYDCAGGSGNGPKYVSGPVQVVGPDHYGLDADHDGIGCED